MVGNENNSSDNGTGSMAGNECQRVNGNWIFEIIGKFGTIRFKEVSDMKWYCVVTESYDAWDNGSEKLSEAIEIASELEEESQILEIDDGENPVCERETKWLSPQEWKEWLDREDGWWLWD